MRGKDKKPRRKRTSYTTTPASVRFWRYVDKETGAPCWLWTGATSPNGYGRFRPGSKDVPMVGPHRFSFELYNGPIASGLVVMHSCDNPACVNPAHLSIGTNKDNTHDAMRKGRMRHYFTPGFNPKRGFGPTKLNIDKVRHIRSSNDTIDSLAEKFGVDRSLIERVKKRKAWTHVE